MEQVFICDAIRTPIGRYAGALSSIRADDLAALPIEYLKQQWRDAYDVELATLEWVDWFNKTRIHSTIGYVSPFEFERRYYDSLTESDKAA